MGVTMLKSPDWHLLIVWYFFLGGIAGGAYFTAAIADNFGSSRDKSVFRIGYVLAQWVRERALLTLEDAVRRMTFQPARIMGLRDRGLVREGMVALIVSRVNSRESETVIPSVLARNLETKVGVPSVPRFLAEYRSE